MTLPPSITISQKIKQLLFNTGSCLSGAICKTFSLPCEKVMVQLPIQHNNIMSFNNRTEQNRTEQNRTEQNRTEQNKTKPSVLICLFSNGLVQFGIHLLHLKYLHIIYISFTYNFFFREGVRGYS